MSKIKIKKLSLVNFKGIKDREVEFSDTITNIHGDNATGKTTIFDAFWWVLFGKDSAGSTQFGIKPQDKNGNDIPKLENEVTATFNVDGRTTVFRRTQKEKWVTKRGEAEPKFTGHTTEFMVDDVPLNQGEYQAKVNSLVSEEIFRLITNPAQFNSLRWDERRRILFELVTDINLEDVAKSRKKFQELIDEMNGKALDEFRTQLRNQIKKAKEAMRDIPSRIDEANRNMPEPVDTKAINAFIQEKEALIEGIEKQISDVSAQAEAKQKKRSELINKKYELERELKEYERSLEDERYEAVRVYEKTVKGLNDVVATIREEKSKASSKIKTLTSEIEYSDKEISALRTKWTAVNEETFTPDLSGANCKHCGQKLPNVDIDTLRTQGIEVFNEGKLERLGAIEKEAAAKVASTQSKKEELETAQNRLSESETAEAETLKDIADLEANKPEAKELTEEQAKRVEEFQGRIKEVQELLDKPSESVDVSEFRTQIKSIRAEIDTEKAKLANNDQIDKTKARIEELEKEEKSLAQQIADLEKKQFLIEELNKAHIDLIEDKINAKFEYVQFRMFQDQINEGVKETCVTLIGGVTYPDANNAAKINAGIDIINVLSAHYNVFAPIFIDNRESVVELLPTASQVVNLYVNEAEKELVIK